MFMNESGCSGTRKIFQTQFSRTYDPIYIYLNILLVSKTLELTRATLNIPIRVDLLAKNQKNANVDFYLRDMRNFMCEGKRWNELTVSNIKETLLLCFTCSAYF